MNLVDILFRSGNSYNGRPLPPGTSSLKASSEDRKRVPTTKQGAKFMDALFGYAKMAGVQPTEQQMLGILDQSGFFAKDGGGMSERRRKANALLRETFGIK